MRLHNAFDHSNRLLKGCACRSLKQKVKALGHVDTMKRRLPSREIHERKEEHRSSPSRRSCSHLAGVTNDSFAKTITIALSPRGTDDDRRERKYDE